MGGSSESCYRIRAEHLVVGLRIWVVGLCAFRLLDLDLGTWMLDFFYVGLWNWFVMVFKPYYGHIDFRRYVFLLGL